MRIAPKPMKGQEIRLEDILKTPTQPAPVDPTAFSVRFDKDAMVMTGVQFHGQIYTVEIQNQLIEPVAGNYEFLKMAVERHEAGGFKPASTEEIYAIFSTLTGKVKEYRAGDSRLFLQASKGIDKINQIWTEHHPLYTFTEINLNLNTKDEVIHNPGTPLRRQYAGEFAGKDGLIKSKATGAKRICQALFDERDTQRIHDVFCDITGHAISIDRDESPQHNPISGVVLIGEEYVVAGGIVYASGVGFHSLGIRMTEVRQ